MPIGYINCQDIIQHKLEHEIIGIETGEASIDWLKLDGGRAWVYDNSRGKWLSTDRLFAFAGRKGRAKKIYLRLIDGQASNLTGYRLSRKATITAVAAQTRTTETWTLRIRKNGNANNLASLAIASATGAHDNTLNVDLDEGDRIQFYAETTTLLGIRDPFIWVEVAWRNTNL